MFVEGGRGGRDALQGGGGGQRGAGGLRVVRLIQPPAWSRLGALVTVNLEETILQCVLTSICLLLNSVTFPDLTV